MAGEEAYLRMGGGPSAQARHVRADGEAIQPVGRQIELGIGGQRVGGLEEPSAGVADGDAAVAQRVPVQRDEIHLRLEWQADGVESQPVDGGRVVEHPTRAVREVGGIVCQRAPAPAVDQCIVLAAVEVDLGVREVGQAAGVVEVQVGEDDVLDGLGGIAQPGYLMTCREGWVALHAEGEAEAAHHARGRRVIVDAEAGVDEDEAVVGLDEQAGRGHMPARHVGRHRRAVEQTNGQPHLDG